MGIAALAAPDMLSSMGATDMAGMGSGAGLFGSGPSVASVDNGFSASMGSSPTNIYQPQNGTGQALQQSSSSASSSSNLAGTAISTVGSIIAGIMNNKATEKANAQNREVFEEERGDKNRQFGLGYEMQKKTQSDEKAAQNEQMRQQAFTNLNNFLASNTAQRQQSAQPLANFGGMLGKAA
jgi:hypothetical protein